MVLRPALARISGAPRAMESTDAIMFFARAQMSVMTPENQGRFEKCSSDLYIHYFFETSGTASCGTTGTLLYRHTSSFTRFGILSSKKIRWRFLTARTLHVKLTKTIFLQSDQHRNAALISCCPCFVHLCHGQAL